LAKEPEANHLRLFTSDDLAKFAEEAKAMRADLLLMESSISEKVLVHEQMLDQLAQKLILQAADAETLEGALEAAALGLKAHSEWRALIAPLAQRLGQRIRDTHRQLEGGDRVGKALQSGPSRGSGDRDDARAGRRRKGAAGAAPDRQSAGSSSEVVEGSVVVPGGGGPGHESPDHQDDRPER
jgi:hypothetical protein